ncbi:FAR1-related protein, partial [Trifolium medium]|nr:FAR1-related protein [Trifolium medium]
MSPNLPVLYEQAVVEANRVEEPQIVAPPPPNVDFRNQFTTDTKFDDRASMEKWVKDLALSLGFVTVIVKSDNGDVQKKGYVHIGCQRGGKYRDLNVVNGVHNHKMTQNFEGHKVAERLTEEEKLLVRQMTKNNTLPRNIMTTLKKGRQMSATTVKHIYNVRYRMGKAVRGPRTELQHL